MDIGIILDSLTASPRARLILFTLLGTILFLALHSVPILPSSSPSLTSTITLEDFPRPILIFQYTPFTQQTETKIEKASISSFEKYAKQWGYGYKRDTTIYSRLELEGHDGESNVLHALVRCVMDEMSRPEHLKADWVLFAPTNSIILNPQISLVDLLPPLPSHPLESTSHTPLILASSSDDTPPTLLPTLLLRISSHLLTILYRLPEVQRVHGLEDIYSTLSYLIKHDEQIRKSYHPLPKTWIGLDNPTSLNKVLHSSYEYEYHKEGYDPRLLISLPFLHEEDGKVLEAVERYSEELYKSASDIEENVLMTEQGTHINGFENSEERLVVKKAAKAWWSSTRANYDGIL